MTAIPTTTGITHRPKPWWRNPYPYIFISPFYILFVLFGLGPIIFSLVVSMYDWRGVRPGDFIFLENYITLFKEPNFYKSLANTVYIWLGTVPVMIFLALVFAVLLNSKLVRWRGAFRTVYFLPVVTSLIITGLIFASLFSTSYGLANNILTHFGLEPVQWLSDSRYMKLILILAILWRWTGNDMVIMLAGLQSIPMEIYEAARVDGANEVQNFWHITVPLMIPVILFDLIISTIGTFNLFEEPYALFGGPGGGVRGAALVTGLYLYSNAFVNARFGFGSSIAWVLAAIIFALSMIQLKVGSRKIQ